MQKTLYILVAVIFSVITNLSAQSTIRGIVKDTSGEVIVGASIAYYNQGDSVILGGNVSDEDGQFVIAVSPNKNYKLRISYLGYRTTEKNVSTGDEKEINIGTIYLKSSSTTLEDFVVKGTVTPMQQLGDTSQYNAAAFKTNPDATVEDLVSKMPGITNENGTIKANGEEVKKVLVDGKAFFGDDASTALKNLPADIVDKIQVFDKMSEQSEFSGFDDGNTTKTLNIITKKDKNKGTFGKVYAGYGTDDRYAAGASLNYFNGARRITVIGMSNNINQQNFSSSDILDVGGTSGGSGGGGRRGGGGGISNLTTPQQRGVATTNSIGINFSDEPSAKLKLSGSYFYNNMFTSNNSDVERSYITTADSSLHYVENSTNTRNNDNHRFNLRMEYQIDSSNSIIWTPSLNFQNTKTGKDLLGETLLAGDSLLNRTVNHNTGNNSGYTIGNDLLYRHKFKKQGRTLSVGLSVNYNDRNGDGGLYASNFYTGNGLDTSLTDQRYTLESNTLTTSANINYTEPISRYSRIAISYSPSLTNSKSDKSTNNLSGTGAYDILDSLLTNRYNNAYHTERGGVSYQFNNKAIQFNAGLNAQYASLNGEQFFPYALKVDKDFFNLLPQAMLNYKFSQNENLRINYRTSTAAPSVSQLQEVIDNTNTLFLTTGNPDLKQSYTNSLNIRYRKTNTRQGTSFVAFLNGSYVNDYVANATYIAQADTQFTPTIFLNKGTQLSRPINLDGRWTSSVFLSYGTPVLNKKINLNLSPSFNVTHTPAIINGLRNNAINYAIGQGVTLSSNISSNIDFSVSYNGSYTFVNNSLQKQNNYNYYAQNTNLRLNYIFLDGFVLNTSLTHTLYSGLGDGFNQNFLLWNAALGYKFFKNRALEVKASVFDILNQNTSIARNITETYIEDSRNQMLTRYFMLTATYTLRKFSGSANRADSNNNQDAYQPERPRGNMGEGDRRNPRGGEGLE